MPSNHPVSAVFGENTDDHAANTWYVSASLYYYLLERWYVKDGAMWGEFEMRRVAERPPPSRDKLAHGVLTPYDVEGESLRLLLALDAMAFLGTRPFLMVTRE